MESFDIESIKVIESRKNRYALRFYDNKNAFEKGRYLFETFTNKTNRNNLTLPFEWNEMIKIKQFQIKEGSIILKGKVAPQLKYESQYVGGAE